MYALRNLSCFDIPELVPYRTLRRQFDHLGRGFFVAEGEKVVRRLIETSFEIQSVLLPPKWQAEYEELLSKRSENVDLFVASVESIEDLAAVSIYQSVLAVARVPAPTPMSALLALHSPRLLLALDHVTNAENVGAVIRSAVALGAQAVLVGGGTCHPYLRRAVRASMGSIFQVPYLPSGDLAQSLLELREAGVRTVAAHPSSNSRQLGEFSLGSDVCVVLGSEGAGICEAVLAACEVHAAIPMRAGVDSLNVAAAAAAFFYEADRQRRRQ